MPTSRNAPKPPGPGRDRILRSAVFALLTYAFGLIPFYLLTPVHESVPSLLVKLQPTFVPTRVLGGVAPATPTPTLRDIVRRVGAEVAPVSGPEASASPTLAPMPTASTSDSRYAFLLLGFGGEGHDGAYLTDSIMVVVVDPDHRTLTLLSLPRDSWVPLQFDGRHSVYEKVNTAFAFAKDPSLYPERLDKYSGATGAGAFASDTVSRLLGIPVKYYLGLDFSGFRQMIDAVGGVDVDVPDSFSARYPANDDPDIDASWMTVHFYKGHEHMNGERAIEFARAREALDNSDEASDFARSRRQRLIMEAFKARLFQPGGLIHLPQLLSIAGSHLDTNYGIPDAAQLSQLALDWKNVKIYQSAITIQNYLEEATGPDGAYILVPSSPDHSWAQIEAFAQRLWKSPETGAQIATTSIRVENDSGVPGAGGRLSDNLLKLGYSVKDPTTGPVRAESQVLDRTPDGAPLVIQQLDADLGTHLTVTTDPSLAAGSDDAMLVLQLGESDADRSVATAVPEEDAPSSLTGVLRFGAWDASFGIPTPTPVPPEDVTRRTSRLSPTALSGTPGTATAGTVVPIPEGTPLPAGSGTATSGPPGVSTPGTAVPTTPLPSTPAPTGSAVVSSPSPALTTTPPKAGSPSPTAPPAPSPTAIKPAATPTPSPRPDPSPTQKH